MAVRKLRQKQLRVSNFALLLVIFKPDVLQIWAGNALLFGGQADDDKIMTARDTLGQWDRQLTVAWWPG